MPRVDAELGGHPGWSRYLNGQRRERRHQGTAPGNAGSARTTVAMATERARPRLLFVGPLPSARGGVAQFASRLPESVVEDADVGVIGFRRLYPRCFKAGRQGSNPSSRPEARIPARAILVPWLPWTWLAAAREIAAFRPDVVVAQWWHPLLGPCLRFLFRCASRGGARVVVVCHNHKPHERFPFSKTLSRLALSEAHTIFTLSTSVAEGVRSLVGHADVQVLAHPPNILAPNGTGVGAREWRARFGNVDGPVVLFFGYVRPYKGLSDLIAAMALVRERAPATLVVAGPFLQPMGRFVRQAKRLQIAEHVRFFPEYVANENVEGLLKAADLLALPYRHATQSGIVPQAAATATPIVATTAGGIPESLNGNALMVPPRNPSALADAIVRGLVDPPRPPRPDGAGWQRWRDALLGSAKAPGRPPRPDAPRSRARRALTAAAWLVVFFFVARVLLNGLGDLSGAKLALSIPTLVGSSALALAARPTDLFAWNALLRATGARVPFRVSSRMFVSAELVRFLPGGILHFFARYRFAARAGVSPRAAVTAMAFDLGLRIAVALVFFIVSLPFWPGTASVLHWLPVALVPLFALPPVRRGFRRLAEVAQRKIGLDLQLRRMERGPLLVSTAWVMLGWLLRGLSGYLLILSLAPISRELVALIAGVVAISWVVGVVTPFAPGGLGVREAVGAFFLGGHIAAAAAVVAMLVIRLQSILTELTVAGAVYAWDATASWRAGRQQRGHGVGQTADQRSRDQGERTRA